MSMILIDPESGEWYRLTRFGEIREGNIFLATDPDKNDEAFIAVADADLPDEYGSFLLERIDRSNTI